MYGLQSMKFLRIKRRQMMFGLVAWKEKEGNGLGALTRRADQPLNVFRNELDALFNRFFGNFLTPFTPEGSWPSWDLDYEDTGKEIVLRAEAPGFEAEDFNIQVS